MYVQDPAYDRPKDRFYVRTGPGLYVHMPGLARTEVPGRPHHKYYSTLGPLAVSPKRPDQRHPNGPSEWPMYVHWARRHIPRLW